MSNKLNNLRRRIGVVRDITYQFTQFKQAIQEKKISLNDSAGLMTEKGSGSGKYFF